MPPQFWGDNTFKVPQNWGASAVLGSPQVEQLAWMRGGIPGFMQEVYSLSGLTLSFPLNHPV
jgi:hypothetical protein